MTGGRPSLIASCFWYFSCVMQRAASVASLGFLPDLGIPRLAPPIETRLGSPSLTAGYGAYPMLAATFLVTGLVSASAWAAAHTYGQLSRKAPLPASKASRPWSSWAVESDGSARPEVATSLMIFAALTAAGLSVGLPSASTIVPPPDATRLLNQTT